MSDLGLFQHRRQLLLPIRSEATNLITPSCPSASHVYFSSARMEPQFMILGHAAGVLAALAHHSAPSGGGLPVGLDVQDVPGAALSAALERDGALLRLPMDPRRCLCSLNRCLARDGVPADACGVGACTFCKALAPGEWLARVIDFAPSLWNASVAAVRQTLLRKAPGGAGATKAVRAGFACGRLALQSHGGFWICTAQDGGN